MIRRNRKNEELVSDPHELLLSLVDMGSLDSDEALLACVTEMSDAECKRVLNSLSLPACCDDAECDDEDDPEVIDEPMADDEDDDLFSSAKSQPLVPAFCSQYYGMWGNFWERK